MAKVQDIRVRVTVDDADLKQAKKDVDALADSFEGVEESIEETNEELGKMPQKTGPAAKGFGGIAKAAKAAGAAVLVAFSAKAIINFTKEAVNLAAAMEQNRVAFKTFLGSADAADKLLGQIEKKAAETPFQFPELVESSKKLLAFNVAAEDIIPTLTSIGDIAAGTGTNVSELAEIYGKAKVQGRLFAEDVNQLTGRGIPIIQEFAKQFGVADAEVKKLVEEGKIGFPQLEQAFKSLTSEGGKFFGLTAAQSQTTAGLISTLRDNVEKLVRGFGEKLLPIVNDVVGGLLRLVGATQSEAKELDRTRTKINKLVPRIQALAVGTQERTDLLNELNGLYPGFLKNLNAETVTNTQLVRRLAAVNKEIVKRIVLAREREKLDKIAEQAADAESKRANRAFLLRGLINKAQGEFNLTVHDTNDVMADAQKTTEDLNRWIERQKNSTTELTKEEKTRLQLARQLAEGIGEFGLRNQVEATEDLNAQQSRLNKFTERYEQLQRELFPASQEVFMEAERGEGILSKLTKRWEKLSETTPREGPLAGSIAALRKNLSELQKGLQEDVIPGTEGYEIQLLRVEAAQIALDNAIKKTNQSLGSGLTQSFLSENAKLLEDFSGTAIETAEMTKDEIDDFYDNFEFPAGLEKDFEEQGEKFGKAASDGIAKAMAEAEQQEAIKKAAEDAIFSSITAISDAVFEIQRQNLERENDAQLQALELRRDRALRIAEETGGDTQAINEKFDKQRAALEKKAAEERKRLAIFEAIINTAVAVTRALTLKPPLSFILAAATGVAGAAQIATISATTFAEGGYTGDGSGRRDATGQRPAGVVHEKEFVFDRFLTKKHRAEFERIHRGESPYAVFGGAPGRGGLIRATLDDKRMIKQLRGMRRDLQEQNRYLKPSTDIRSRNFARGAHTRL